MKISAIVAAVAPLSVLLLAACDRTRTPLLAARRPQAKPVISFN